MTADLASWMTPLDGEGLVLREWQDDDLAALTELFDHPSIDAWTPLASPFDRPAATDYLARARRGRATGAILQLAITEDGVKPLGEVLLFLGDGQGELAYAVGVEHRGRSLGTRAVRVVVERALADRPVGLAALPLSRLVLTVRPDNIASQVVARNCGFELTDEPLVTRECKGRTHEFETWARRGRLA